MGIQCIGGQLEYFTAHGIIGTLKQAQVYFNAYGKSPTVIVWIFLNV
jgi:hypothetical protein